MKKLLMAFGILVVALAAAAVVLPFLIPADAVASRIAAQVKASTGRDLRFEGPVRLTVIPRLAIDAADVAFANAQGAAAKDMARLKSLEVELALRPLFSGEVEVDRFVLNEPVIHLEVDAQGRPNWSFAGAPRSPASSAGGPGGTPREASSLSELRLGDVHIARGLVTYVDHRSGTRHELRDIDVKVKLPSLDQPLEAVGAFVWREKKISVRANAAKPRALVEGGATPLSATVDAEPVRFSLAGVLTKTEPLVMEGDIDLSIPSVRNFAAWAATPLDMPGSGFGPLSLVGKIAVAGPKIAFTGAELALDDLKGKGEMRLDTSGVRPLIAAKLDLDRLDLNPYLPPAGAAPGQAAPPAAPPPPAQAGGGPGQAGWIDEPINVAPLKAFDAELDLAAREMRYRKIALEKGRIAAKLKEGRLIAELAELVLYRGNGRGTVELDGANAVPHLAAAFKLDGVALEPLLKDAADFDRLSGSGAFEFDVKADGRSQRELVSTVDGSGKIAFRDGKVKGIALGSLLRQQGGDSGGETEFSELSGTFRIDNGILRNDDLALRSPVLTVSGAGTVDLPRRTVEYRVTPRVSGTELMVPVAIKGPWERLTYLPDVGGLLQRLPGIASPPSGQPPGAPGGGAPAAPRPQDLLRGLLGR